MNDLFRGDGPQAGGGAVTSSTSGSSSHTTVDTSCALVSSGACMFRACFEFETRRTNGSFSRLKA